MNKIVLVRVQHQHYKMQILYKSTHVYCVTVIA